MATAILRFYEELNDFLPRAIRKQDMPVEFREPAPVRHLIELCGIPHTEVEIVLLNGLSVDLEQQVRDGDRVSVYPVFESLDITPLLRLRDYPLRSMLFVADAHLGKLAGYLRMLGFDTLYRNDWQDSDLVRISSEQHRILLSRDRALLMCSAITHGCYIRATRPRKQLSDLVGRLDLCGQSAPFTRCMECNGELKHLAASDLSQDLLVHVRKSNSRFLCCADCGKTYWEGSHYRVMAHWIAELCPKDEGPL